MFQFNMDSKFKGIVWVGNIYQRFEALCLEMDDMETFQYVEDQLQTVGANCSLHLLPIRRKNFNLSVLQNANKDSNISVNKDCIQKELIHYKFRFIFRAKHRNEHGLAQACTNEAHDTDSTLDDALLESKAVPKLELETVPAPVPSHNKVKLEESCIVVDSSELHSLSIELQEHRSFKEKFQEAFSLKSRLWKPDDEQHRNSVEQSSESNKSEKEKYWKAGMADTYSLIGAFYSKPSPPLPPFFLKTPKLPLHFPSKSMAAHRHCSSNPRPSQPSLLVFSGGTAFNGVVEELKKLTVRVAHVLPVSDDGGSTAEIVRVLGCVLVLIMIWKFPLMWSCCGDIRSRCLRLADESTAEALAVRRLLGHRLPINPQQAKSEWLYKFWKENIHYGKVYQNHTGKLFEHFWLTFRMRLGYVILRRPNESFCFSNGRHYYNLSDNFVLGIAALGIFSLQEHMLQFFVFTCFRYSRRKFGPPSHFNSNDRLTLGCELWVHMTYLANYLSPTGPVVGWDNHTRQKNEFPIQPTSLDQVDKGRSSVPALPSRIKRVFYMSSEGTNSLHEVFPTVNQAVLDQLSNVDCIVYAMGSLFTSLCPSLVLLGIGEIISSRSCPKVLLLNGSHDRETSGFSASSFVTAITDALNRTYGTSHNCLRNLPSQYINTLLVPKDGEIPIDIQSLSSQGIFDVVIVNSIHDPKWAQFLIQSH
ncbi:hypothetical protein CXB51_014018 [Gossypium anomalum]|uniref:Uncharacterized protein n=1 Tax=Gossypium anomalum TaxID=47600 RepID=A0A8J5YJZ0_9ROSI|nr:hypothetical protein CXB51_014018 [Gossypium anomalum]